MIDEAPPLPSFADYARWASDIGLVAQFEPVVAGPQQLLCLSIVGANGRHAIDFCDTPQDLLLSHSIARLDRTLAVKSAFFL
ncbi:MAG TPA: hypothetical protein VN222_11950 [Novosphingobium sp.]|nr:hypothetical protein [Novosphingobium sp.]